MKVYKKLQKNAVMSPSKWVSFIFGLALLLFTTYYPLPTTYTLAASHPRIFFSPSEAELAIGSTFITELRFETAEVKINAISVALEWQLNLLELVEISNGGSAFTLFPEAPAATDSTVEWQAGVPGGFTGSGLVARLTWRALKEGTTVVKLAPSTTLLAHDAMGSVLATSLAATVFNIIKTDIKLPLIESSDYPDETAWNSSPFIRMSWSPRPGSTYSYVLSYLPDEVPDTVPDEPIGSIKLAPESDGIFYFHLRECKAQVCSQTVTRRAQKDTKPPENLQVQLGQNQEAYEGLWFVNFSATDATSGIARYEVRENRDDSAGQWAVSDGPYVLKDQSRKSTIEVKAVDKAGNEKVTVIPPLARLASFWWLIGAIIIIAAAGLFWLGYYFHILGNQHPKITTQK